MKNVDIVKNMKYKKNMKDDIPTEFWKEYLNADSLDRTKVLLPVAKVILRFALEHNEMKKKSNNKLLQNDNSFTRLLQDYFNDLEDTIYQLNIKGE